jgi:Protein of unknown function (DUF4026)/Uncharacterized protein conserved in bacteria (DUF2314)
MLSWLTGVTPARAVVFLPGGEGAKPDAVRERLQAAGISRVEAKPGEPWDLRVKDPSWGSATIEAAPDVPDPEPAIRFASNLTDVDKAHVRPPYTAVTITVQAQTKRVLADRKTLLRYAAAVMGDTGLITLDWQSHLPWTRDALADELAHDADLDIEALYTIEHVYTTDAHGKRTVEWAHTHGLGDVGAFDLDVLAPLPDFVDRGHEAFRAIAQLALAQKISIDSGEFVFGKPGGVARAVRADDFMRQAEPRWRDLRSGPDHDQDRAVLCDPAGGGLLGFLRRDVGPAPMSFARRPIPETFASLVPTEYNDLMADRAAKTLGVLRRYREEFAAVEPVTLVKLGYPTRSGDREHLWFQVHEMGDDWIDGTLGNRPFHVDLKPGERARHSLDQLSDWLLLTPAGQISPRSSYVARVLRDQQPEATS